MKKPLLYLGLLAFSLASCTKDEESDTTAPTIGDVTINGKTEHLTVNTGSDLNFEASLSDNEELGQFKIDIHDIFDDHSHGKKNANPWVYTETTNLSGKSQDFTSTVQVENDITAGPYHAIFRLIDKSGNESDFKEIDFLVQNGNQAQISITSPDFSSEVHVDKGDILVIKGQITDNVDIEEITISLGEDAHGKNLDEDIFDADFDLTGSNDLVWDFQADGNVNINIPTTAESGHYVLMVRVEDNEGNLNIFEGEVHIE